jgi:magnesium transporter
MVYIGDRQRSGVKISIMDYNEREFTEHETLAVEECFPYKNKPTVTWINVDNVSNLEVIEKIGCCFNIHPLTLEDLVNTEARPKIDDYGHYIFIILKMLLYDEKLGRGRTEQVSLIVGTNYVISFQEGFEGDVFDPVRDRIRKSRGHIRENGADYLCYSLIDIIVDNYFSILEKVGDQIEKIEESLLGEPGPSMLNEIHNLKREMLYLRKAVWPLREVINLIVRSESPLFKSVAILHMRDIYDHTIQVIDTVEVLREMVASMLDIYISSMSYRMSEVMKVLTIIATIFIPLTFIAGVYGMNFKNMPEIEWPLGYPFALTIMLVVGLSLLAFFKRRNWI